MIRAAAVLLLAVLAACSPAPEPLPEPPPAPPPVPIRAGRLHRLEAAYEEAHSRYLAYRSLRICAPSGAVPCQDPEETARLRALDRRARRAIINLERSRQLRSSASSSIENFGAAARAVRVKEYP